MKFAVLSSVSVNPADDVFALVYVSPVNIFVFPVPLVTVKIAPMYEVDPERVTTTDFVPVPGAFIYQHDVVPDSPVPCAAVYTRSIATPP